MQICNSNKLFSICVAFQIFFLFFCCCFLQFFLHFPDERYASHFQRFYVNASSGHSHLTGQRIDRVTDSFTKWRMCMHVCMFLGSCFAVGCACAAQTIRRPAGRLSCNFKWGLSLLGKNANVIKMRKIRKVLRSSSFCCLHCIIVVLNSNNNKSRS